MALCGTFTFIKPKVATLVVGDRLEEGYTVDITADNVHALGTMEDLKAYALGVACIEQKADVIVAASYKVHVQKDGSAKVQIRGFRANYENWQDVKESDYNWITPVFGSDLSKDKASKATESIKKNR